MRYTTEEYDFPDKLYQEHWEKAYAWGIVEENDSKQELIACIETCPEEWSNRLMVTELWVHEKLRRNGIGHALMEVKTAGEFRAQAGCYFGNTVL